MNKDKRRPFKKTWGYFESLTISLGIFLAGLCFELITQIPTPVIYFPYNLIMLIALVLSCFFLHKLSHSKKNIAWFSSVYASVGAIVLFLFLSLIMALVPQQVNPNQYVFIYSVTSSWAYYLATLYLLLVLGMVTIGRLGALNRVNIMFFLNHGGLWITLAAASLGAGDVKKYSMTLSEGKTTWLALDEKNKTVEMDFAFLLHSFEKEEYPAKIAFADAKTGDFLSHGRSMAIFEMDQKKSISFGEYHVDVLKYFPSSVYYGHAYHENNSYGATQSYKLRVKNLDTQEEVVDWVGVGSPIGEPRYIVLNDSIVITALSPHAKRYASYVRVYTKDQKIYDAVIEVNKPQVVAGHKVYQTGYDNKKGRWSDISILEIVKDPWLPVVYFGIFLFLAGTVMIIWFGKRR